VSQVNDNVVVDSRLRPQCSIYCCCIQRQSQTAWRPWRICCKGYYGKHDVIYKSNKTGST